MEGASERRGRIVCTDCRPQTNPSHCALQRPTNGFMRPSHWIQPKCSNAPVSERRELAAHRLGQASSFPLCCCWLVGWLGAHCAIRLPVGFFLLFVRCLEEALGLVICCAYAFVSVFFNLRWVPLQGENCIGHRSAIRTQNSLES